MPTTFASSVRSVVNSTKPKPRLAWLIACASLLFGMTTAFGQIERPTDAPPPLTPEASLASIHLAEGFRLELIAAEPLVVEPSGVCWDERGRLFVCELHGYNLEGQYDIDELNRTGQLDRIVRRVQAGEAAKRQAIAETYGTIKRLLDRDGDGRIDEAQIFADRLPPCYGVCPARGGIIAACAPDIYFLADRDGDGVAEVKERLFTGFAVGALERGVSAPQWGLDGWIYFGKGHGGGRITGPRLPEPVDLANIDFRIKADGSAIEPVVGGTHTFGFAMTGGGERFVISTATPGIYVAPIPWRYLARNPDAAISGLEQNALADQHVYPASRPHPWRTRRAEDPGFAKYYTDRYGVAESAPNGYFTSACSPLVYQDDAMPALRGQLLACEPAQNMIFRGLLRRDGVPLRIERPASEVSREFLAAEDPWFHPIALSHSPDGGVCVVDFYREIIEDYSAIPRYLQQQYGLVNGQDRGRLYRLTHAAAAPPLDADMSKLSRQELARETVGGRFWRRQTARRLLVERHATADVDSTSALGDDIRRGLASTVDSAAWLNGLYALADLDALTKADLLTALSHHDPLVRVHGLRLSESRWSEDRELLEASLTLAASLANHNAEGDQAALILQAALTLGEIHDRQSLLILARLARRHGNLRWMTDALLTSLSGRGGDMLVELLEAPSKIGEAVSLIEPLCRAIAARGDANEISRGLMALSAAENAGWQADGLRGLAAGSQPRELPLPDAARAAIAKFAQAPRAETRQTAAKLIRVWRLESSADHAARLAAAAQTLQDLQQPPDARLAAANELAEDEDSSAATTLIEAFASASPKIQQAIIAGLLARRERWSALLDALEQGKLPTAGLSAVQRNTLLEQRDAAGRERATRLFPSSSGVKNEQLERYLAALSRPRDLGRGRELFQQHCATCHAMRSEGFAVGPDLSAEFQRAEEAIVRDILAPSETITAGYAAYNVVTSDGRVFSGLLSLESAGSLTLRMPGGKEETILRKDLESIAAMSVSIMPEELAKLLSAADVADLIAWLRAPTSRVVLVDDDERFAAQLTEGGGEAEFTAGSAFSGARALRVTPPQRFSPRIAGWNFRIRRQPAAGEYRYLRFAWRVDGGRGAMIELANDGRWPDARSEKLRYFAGENATTWQAMLVSIEAPSDWTLVTRDLWADVGDCTITGIAPTAIGGAVLFDRIELLRTLDDDERPMR